MTKPQQMDAFDISAFYLIEKINADCKRFKGSRSAFAKKIKQQLGLSVQFWETPFGVVASVDYNDIIQLFEAYAVQQAAIFGKSTQPAKMPKNRPSIRKP